MTDERDEEMNEELKCLHGLHSLLCYAMRELAGMSERLQEAEDGVAAAEAALRARMHSVERGATSDDLIDAHESAVH